MIEINELFIRIPGENAEAGRAMVGEIAQRVASGLPENCDSKNLEGLNVRVTINPAMTSEQVADRIAQEIILQLKLL